MNSKNISMHKSNLNGSEIIYKVRLSRRAKRVQLVINQAGELQVVIPFSNKSFDHTSFVNSKSKWLLKHLRTNTEKKYLYLGREIKIKINYKLFIKKPEFRFSDYNLFINTPQNESYTYDEVFYYWLYQKAHELLPQRTLHLAQQYNFKPSKITVRKQQTRWGSCSGSGVISLNYKLMALKQSIIDYVIIHELCHLIHLNHSSEFWETVKSVLPDYAKLRKELRLSRV